MTTTGSLIDISSPLQEICRLLGLDYELVHALVFRPGHVTADSFVRDANGSIAMCLDGTPETHTVSEPVRTYG